MKTWIFILLMMLQGGAPATLSPAPKEFVSIFMSNTVVTNDEEHGSSADVKADAESDSRPQPRALTSAQANRAGPAPSQTVCESDDDCNSNQYCYEDTKVCATCVDCSVYFRLHSNSGCSKSAQQCGACLKGYQNEVFSNGKARDSCTRIPTMQPDSVFNPGTTYNTPHLWFFLGFVIIGLGVSVYIAFVWSYNKCHGPEKRPMFWPGVNRRLMNYNLPSAPPMPCKDPEIIRNWAGEPLVSNHELTTIMPTQSVPYDPDAPKQCSTEFEEGEHTEFFSDNSEDVQYSGAVGPSPPDLSDDSTVPSNWTPQNFSANTLVTSFSGLLSNGFGSINNNNNNNNNNNHLVYPNSVVRTGQNTPPFMPSSDPFANESTNSGEHSHHQSHRFSPSPGAVGPVQVIVQPGGQGSSPVECRVEFTVNNIQINEY